MSTPSGTDVSARERLIVALDCPPCQARELAARLSGQVAWLKVGMTLYYAAGPSIVGDLKERGFSVFVDLKLHDIPHQVRGAARALAEVGADLLTVHAAGGMAMMRAAVEGVAEAGSAPAGGPAAPARPAILAITVLTSMDTEALRTVGAASSIEEQVVRLATLSREAGLGGVVCSPREASMLRALLGADALIVTPGVRPREAELGDQSRVATPAEACEAGASHLVIGRPITAAPDPVAAFEEIVRSIDDRDHQ
jgi:orotidine-5'-phosphate decarboxylase